MKAKRIDFDGNGIQGLKEIWLSILLGENKAANGPLRYDWEGIQNIDERLKWLDNNEVESIVVRRALLADPAWARRIHEGRVVEIRAFTPDSLHTLF
ncbi:hypothetical protein PC41400_10550 [Paenibacillus chitinolyticus]|uniref:Uncharacterized protein n=1 Tax=Paenibacillus chitinolyticus TaxID=79263 RepID=A0A410WUT4_9BACL|nr:hypothetical protein [Paenibacillus chitinolyticus]MCY9593046.1 hypothetical protein [Paenibacillus chitinolyticus]MCY9595222.1 hypothetical protein [Paenibacillus chitinolyticus]QAV18081.1 hypothetical protein PC41400_10550 [Paenibacillus chitinolyticus]